MEMGSPMCHQMAPHDRESDGLSNDATMLLHIDGQHRQSDQIGECGGAYGRAFSKYALEVQVIELETGTTLAQ